MAPRINKLGERVKSNGFEQTMEQVAYSWFNCLIAIHSMELHDYLGYSRRVLSHPEHPTGFEILKECTGYSYDSVIVPYLAGAKSVVIEDPYIRATHQVQNFIRFCEAILKQRTVKKSS